MTPSLTISSLHRPPKLLTPTAAAFSGGSQARVAGLCEPRFSCADATPCELPEATLSQTIGRPSGVPVASRQVTTAGPLLLVCSRGLETAGEREQEESRKRCSSSNAADKPSDDRIKKRRGRGSGDNTGIRSKSDATRMQAELTRSPAAGDGSHWLRSSVRIARWTWTISSALATAPRALLQRLPRKQQSGRAIALQRLKSRSKSFAAEQNLKIEEQNMRERHELLAKQRKGSS